MYARARSTASRSAATAKPAGSGTRAVMSATMPGFVPQVTWGARLAVSSVMRESYVAPSSVHSRRQRATARVNRSPAGARGRPCR